MEIIQRYFTTKSQIGSRIEIKDLSVTYRANNDFDSARTTCPPALHDITLSCPPGTATLLTGPSGSGKSTLLRAVNGLATHLDQTDISGKISIITHDAEFDTTTTDLTTLGQYVSTVFQNPRNQFFTATVLEELAFTGSNLGHELDHILNSVTYAAQLTQTTQLLKTKLKELSGGQLQRVAYAAAISSIPHVLLLDEPTSNLDVSSIEDLRTLMLLLKKAGVTLLIAEHRLFYLHDIVDHVATLHNGSITAVHSPEQFFGQSDKDRRATGLRSLVRPTLTIHSESDNSPDIRHNTRQSEMSSGVQIRNLRYSYGTTPVLNIKKLDISAGRITALMGPCGAGKSTLARIIAGLTPAGRGSIISVGGVSRTPRELLAHSAMVMQDVHRQLFAVTTRDEITTGKRCASNVDPDTVLAALHLEDFADQHPMSLSGGQKQRTVVGAALATQAEIYIFDEPTSGVDYEHLVAIATLFRELADRGVTVLVITHDAELVSACADDVVTLGPLSSPHGQNNVTTVETRRSTEGTL